MTDATPKIELSGVTKSFGAERVLNGIDLAVAPGESLVLIGPSGSGKTVALKCIVGLLRPDGGRILIDGEDVTKARGSARDALLGRFGMLFQQAALFDSLPVWRNVGFRLMQDKPQSPAEVRQIVDRTLRSVGLEPAVGDLLPAELSGGMQKRVGIARAIAARPEIILLDEPTAGLDPIMSRVIAELIVTNVRELGATAVSVTSDISTAVRIGDRIAMLDDGRVVWCGPADDLTRTGIDKVDRFIHKWKVETQAAA